MATGAAALSWGSRPPTSPWPTDIALPADAVYAGHYRRADGSLHQAAISVGRRPTFYEPGTAPVLVEAYLLHFDGDLYGEAAAGCPSPIDCEGSSASTPSKP